ncbi:Ig-like domain-containing protein, partial [Pedobacter sp. PF22-3]|uniref:Ig-like domain-containing protein n=1 Tax=Pedobacter sp. PF22-3 TaxID=2994467 RepID=UPI002246C7FF
MKKFYKKVFRFLFIVLALIISTLNASAALSKGDLAVIGMNGDADPSTTIRSFAVVALNTINTGELIYFTDRGWINTYSSTSGHFVASSTATVEGTFQWQLSQNITAGTIIIFKIDLASRTVSGITGNGNSLPAADLLSILPNTWTNATLSANPWNPATGDQIMIYQGSDSSPSFIFAFNNIRLTTTAGTTSNGWHINTTNSEPSSQLAGYSELPSDLGTTYSTGFLTPTSNSRYPNEKYNPSFSTGTKATFLADITNTSNWTNKTTGGTPYDFSAGFGTNNTKQFNFSNSTAPTVTAAKISISGASGTGGAYKIGDVVTATWDNTTGGDNNSGVTTVTIDFSQFGGGTAVTATNSSDTWTATYTIVAGNINATNRNVSVTATNSVGPTTTADDANATVDNIAPSVVISSTAGSSGGSTSTSPIPFTVTFSETVTGFLAGDITPGNATISGFSGNGTTYTFNATPTANGAVTINIAANVAQDAAGNGNAAASQFSITYTQAVAAPTVTALSPTSGPTGGGTSVTITGTNFTGATAVTFGVTA